MWIESQLLLNKKSVVVLRAESPDDFKLRQRLGTYVQIHYGALKGQLNQSHKYL